MYEVAKKERSNLFVSVFLLGPTVTALLIVALICSYKSISNLNQKGFFDLINEFEYDLQRIIPQITTISSWFWQEFEKGYLFISASSGTVILFLVKKSKFDNLKTRIKSVGQYLPEANFSILRFNK